MKLLVDVADNKVAAFMEVVKDYTSVKAKTISAPDAELFEEINEIKKAFKNAEKIKQRKLKGRPAEELLNEL